jgi:hypothetical protein
MNARMRAYVAMAKAKVALAVYEALLRESKAYLAEKRLTVIGTLERVLSEMAATGYVEKAAASSQASPGTKGWNRPS